ncbi:MAG: hypothetical protein HY559_00605 [Gammaproteobacteria bacterium]|nr:hypothetical protein [Gammaproteobacteria bacterium]
MKVFRKILRITLFFLSFFWGGNSWAVYEWDGTPDPNVIPQLHYGSPETFAEFHGYLHVMYSDFEKDGEENDRGDSGFDQHYFVFNAIAQLRKNLTVFGEIEYEHGGEEIRVDRA